MRRARARSGHDLRGRATNPINPINPINPGSGPSARCFSATGPVNFYRLQALDGDVHPGGSRFEITTRALQSRHLIPTGQHFRSIAVGIMARAKERYPVELYAFGGLSNHLHLLLGADDVDKLAGFMGFVNSNLARRIVSKVYVPVPENGD